MLHSTTTVKVLIIVLQEELKTSRTRRATPSCIQIHTLMLAGLINTIPPSLRIGGFGKLTRSDWLVALSASTQIYNGFTPTGIITVCYWPHHVAARINLKLSCKSLFWAYFLTIDADAHGTLDNLSPRKHLSTSLRPIHQGFSNLPQVFIQAVRKLPKAPCD